MWTSAFGVSSNPHRLAYKHTNARFNILITGAEGSAMTLTQRGLNPLHSDHELQLVVSLCTIERICLTALVGLTKTQELLKLAEGELYIYTSLEGLHLPRSSVQTTVSKSYLDVSLPGNHPV